MEIRPLPDPADATEATDATDSEPLGGPDPAPPVAALLAAADPAPLDSAAAWSAARAGSPLLAARDDLTPLRLTGPDRIDFLHGQISAPLRGRPVGAFEAGLLLDHKGHAHAQLGVAVRADDLFVVVAGGAGGYVERELRRHIVFDQVDLQALPQALAGLTLLGAAPLLAALGWEVPADGSFCEVPFADAKLLLHREVAAPPGSVTLHALRRQLPELIAALLEAGARALAPGVFAEQRIAAGVPLVPLDAGSGVLPQEAGLESLVSYRKGCYLGQEIMARIEARGRLKRSLAGVRFEAPPDADHPPPAGTALTAAGRTVGRLGSVACHPQHGWIALAVLRDDVAATADLAAERWRGRRAPLPFDPPPD